MFRKGYSYVEIIVSIAIFTLVIIPILNLNKNQLIYYNKLEKINYDFYFFDKIMKAIELSDYEKIEKYIGKNEILNFQSYENLHFLPNIGKITKDQFDNRNYKIYFDISEKDIDYYIANKKILDINIKMTSKDKSYEANISKF